MSKFNYKTSKDHKRLKELLDSGKKVIVIDERNKAFIAYKELSEPENNYNLGAFFWEEKYESKHGHPLVKCCEEYGIEFIEPNGDEQSMITETKPEVDLGELIKQEIVKVYETYTRPDYIEENTTEAAYDFDEHIARHFAEWERKRTLDKVVEWMKANLTYTHPRKGVETCMVNIPAFLDTMNEENT